MQKLRFLLAFWLAIAATGVWADTVDSLTVDDQTVDTIPDQVKMGDGTMVKGRSTCHRPSRPSAATLSMDATCVRLCFLPV